jgi:hypothetical protein
MAREMGIYLVQHEWKPERSEEVKAVVSGVIEKERTRRLPDGHQLIGVMLSANEPKALCVWESKSRSELEGLLESVNPPTEHSITEYQILFGVSKV